MLISLPPTSARTPADLEFVRPELVRSLGAHSFHRTEFGFGFFIRESASCVSLITAEMSDYPDMPCFDVDFWQYHHSDGLPQFLKIHQLFNVPECELDNILISEIHPGDILDEWLDFI